MNNITITLAVLLMLSSCASTTPLPDVSGSRVRALNPTKWDHREAVRRKQAEVGSMWFNDFNK